MKTEDERDDRIGALMDEAVRLLHPTPDVSRAMRGGSRRRAVRLTASVLGVAVFVGAVGWAGLAIRNNASTVAWRSFGGPSSTVWTIRYPEGWRLEATGRCSYEPRVGGAVFTNVGYTFRNPQGQVPGCGDRFVLDGFPRDGVAVSVQPQGIIAGLLPPSPPTPFPIRMAQLELAPGVVGGVRNRYLGVMIGRNQPITLRVWTGPDATPQARAEVARVVASFTMTGEVKWVTRGVEGTGVSVEAPDNWQTRRKNGGVLITSYPPRENRGRCPIRTVRMLRGIRAADAMIWIPPTGSIPPSGTPFDPFTPPFAMVDSGLSRCQGVSTSMRWLVFRDSIGGRKVLVDVVYGSEALRTDTGRIVPLILRSLRFGPGASPAPDATVAPLPRNTPPGV